MLDAPDLHKIPRIQLNANVQCISTTVQRLRLHARPRVPRLSASIRSESNLTVEGH